MGIKRWLREILSPPCSGSGSRSSSASNHHEFLFEKLPVDIVQHINSLLTVRDAARAACVSRLFLHSWRCHSNLTLSTTTLGLTPKKSLDDAYVILISTVDQILEKHSGSGVEIFSLDLRFCENIDDSYLDRWLQSVVHAGIKEVSLVMMKREYNFPCSVLSDEAAAGSIRSLDLDGCAFHPTEALGCLRGLRRLRLCSVDITHEALGHLLSKSSALEHMDIICCNNIICLTIPCTLHKLTFLRVGFSQRLQSLDISAPNLSTFHCVGTLVKDISVADPWQLKDVYLSSYSPCHTLSFPRATLPAVARNVESLALFSLDENFNTPMLISKFPCLKKLEINISRPRGAFDFDVLPLVSLLDASPTMNSFILRVGNYVLWHDDSVVGGDNANYVRWKPQCRYDRLTHVIITGFRSNKNLIQFVIYIIESAPSLESLTLDTTPGYPWKCGITGKKERCCWMNKWSIAEAQGAVKAAKRYIAERVPTGVRFQVLEPCSRCHIRKRW